MLNPGGPPNQPSESTVTAAPVQPHKPTLSSPVIKSLADGSRCADVGLIRPDEIVGLFREPMIAEVIWFDIEDSPHMRFLARRTPIAYGLESVPRELAAEYGG